MSNLRKHTNRVIRNKESCRSRHDDRFSELGAYYDYYTDDLIRSLTTDIQPEQIVPGGDGLGYGLSFPEATTFYGDPGGATATLERWAMTEDSIFRISKTAEWSGFGPRELAKQVLDRRSIIPGTKKRRTKAIASAIMSIENTDQISIDEFLIPEAGINDDVIYDMRLAADSLSYESGNQPIKQIQIDPKLTDLPSEKALRTQAQEDSKRRLVYIAARKEIGRPKQFSEPGTGPSDAQVTQRALQLGAARVKYERTIQPGPEDIERQREYIIHNQLHGLIVATRSLKRVVHAIREGKVVMPTKAQDTASRYEKLLSLPVRRGESKTLKFDNGGEITVSIN